MSVIESLPQLRDGKEEDDGDPEARDLTNKKFWKKLENTFRDTIEMVREDAKEMGIDLDDPNLQAEVEAQERLERRRAAKNRPVARGAMAYLEAVDKWFKGRAGFPREGNRIGNTGSDRWAIRVVNTRS